MRTIAVLSGRLANPVTGQDARIDQLRGDMPNGIRQTKNRYAIATKRCHGHDKETPS
ncbi:hypothetical protein [Allorhodopirellula heiligendammensis]|uniref:hypothetical protein n=1 Tax=Allorhodopirellula heiligendammensis TaxID=2714739 RepID=UPI00265FFB2D|nr:hypothetical protein [Allorhodopirellula heiligendammensis]